MSWQAREQNQSMSKLGSQFTYSCFSLRDYPPAIKSELPLRQQFRIFGRPAMKTETRVSGCREGAT
jgi:hypothetical protein